ncbi:MAG: hypothetical protein E7172_03350 [Firmicutes bacterium]|nr:hypothetical protein [Bacillota bacterium]
MNNEQKFFLSLQTLPGDHVYIDVSQLNISNEYYPTSLAEIDSFTMHFTKEEIKESIKISNIVEEKYLEGKLIIVDNQKHKPLEVITKDFLNDFKVETFLQKAINDKVLSNNLINKFNALVKDENAADLFQNAVKNKKLESVLQVIFNIPYLIQRKFIIYLIETYNKVKTK